MRWSNFEFHSNKGLILCQTTDCVSLLISYTHNCIHYLTLLNTAMKHYLLVFLIGVLFMSCSEQKKSTQSQKEISNQEIEGTWKRLSALNIVKNDTTHVDYTKGVEGIKIIGKDHFAFFQHDTNGGKDSTAQYSSGGGRYVLEGNHYTEYLDYCQARGWENHKFELASEKLRF